MKSKSAIFSYIVMCRHVLQAVLYLKNKSQYLFYEQYLLWKGWPYAVYPAYGEGEERL